MNVKKGLAWTAGIIAVIGCSIGLVFFLLTRGEIPTNSSKQETSTSVNEDKEDINSSEEFDKEVVNEPTPTSVITMSDGSDGHRFISTYHTFYNKTLGHGKIHSANYDEQVTTAKEILQKLENVEITNDAITNDFQSIEENAEKLIDKNSDKTLRNIHRLFHDLDIYLNGYDRNPLFHVTEYKGN